MRIGIIIYGSLDNITGGFIYDRNLVSYLRASRHTVEVFALPWRRYGQHLTDNFSDALTSQIRKANISLLLQDELCHPSLFALNKRIKPIVGGPIVSIVHHLRSSEQHPALLLPFYRAIEKKYLSTVDAWVFNSQTTRSVVTHFTRQGRPFVVAYPSGSRVSGLTSDQIKSRVNRERPLHIVFVGSVIPRKGLHVLLNSLAKIKTSPQMLREPMRLTIIGNIRADPKYFQSIQHQIHRLYLEEQVRVMGLVDQESLIRNLSEADVLVVPSDYEGFGIVYLEAMAFGLPAVASTAGAAHEIITPGKDGFLIPPGDSDALADVLTLLQDNRRRLMSMSLAARKRFEQQPTWAETAARIERFLQNL